MADEEKLGYTLWFGAGSGSINLTREPCMTEVERALRKIIG